MCFSEPASPKEGRRNRLPHLAVHALEGLVGQAVSPVAENQMRTWDYYWRAYDRWKRIGSIKWINAAGRLSRNQAHERR
jgi:hypothetical protein